MVVQPDGKIVVVGSTFRDFAPRPCPLQPQRHARHELLRRRQADDRLRGSASTRWRSRRTARSSWSAASDSELRARPLQPQRLARHELLRRRQADDRLRGLRRRGDRSGDPGRTARSSSSVPPRTPLPARSRTSRSPATTRTARSTRASPATASRRPTSGPTATERPGWRSRATARSSRSAAAGRGRRDFALARYNPNGSLDTSFSGDGKQTTDFGGVDEANGVAIQADGKIVAVGDASQRTGAASRSPATTPTARSTRASPATASRRPTSGCASTRRTGWRSRATARSSRSAAAARRLRARPLQPQRLARHELLRRRQADDRLRRLRRGERGGDPGERQDRRGRRQRIQRLRVRRLRPRPLQPQRLARHDLLRRRQADDRLRRRTTRRTGWRSRATARSSRSGPRARHDGIGLRARPLQPQRLARHELLRRRQADDRLRGRVEPRRRRGDPGRRQDRRRSAHASGPLPADDFALARYNPNGSLDTTFSGDGKQTTDFGATDRGERRGDPGRRQDRRGRHRADDRRRLRARPLQPQRHARHELLRRRQADDRLRRLCDAGERGGAPGGRQDRRGRAPRATTAPTSRSPATTRTARSTRASPATASRRPTSAASTRRTRWRSRATARSSRSGAAGPARGDDFALARYNPNGSLDTSFSGDGKQTTDFGGATTRRTGVALQGDGKIVAAGYASGGASLRLRPRPLQPQRLARHHLLRRRQTEDQLRGRRRGERSGAPGGWQDRRGRARPRFRRNQRFRARPLPGWLSQGRISARGGRLAMQKVVGSNPISRFVRATPPPTPRTRFTPRSWALIVCGRRW